MLTQILTTLLLPTLLLAAPTSLLSPRQSACIPTSYTITSFTSTPQAVHFAFQSTFSSISAVSDPATQGTTCDASAANGVFPSEFACATGRSNLIIGLRSDTPGNKYQVSHFWKCDGKNWASSTPVEIDVGTGRADFVPQNVREVPCGTPTCP